MEFQRAIVTGGAGFIGSHLVERLLKGHCEVYAFDNFDPYYGGKEGNLDECNPQEGFEIVKGDVLKYEELVEILKRSNAQVIFHLAAQPGVGFSIENPIKTNVVNTQGTLNVLRAALEMKLQKVVFASSSSVYGNPSVTPVAEDQPTRPLSVYGASKLAAENYALIYHRLFALPVVCLRYHTVYGPRNRPDMAIYKWSKAMVAGQPIRLYGDGSQKRDFTYVDDIVEGTILAATKESAVGEVFNLAAGRTVDLNHVLTELEHLLGVPSPTISFEPTKPWDPLTTHADISKAIQMLDYNPHVSIEPGLQLFTKWFQKARKTRSVFT